MLCSKFIQNNQKNQSFLSTSKRDEQIGQALVLLLFYGLSPDVFEECFRIFQIDTYNDKLRQSMSP